MKSRHRASRRHRSSHLAAALVSLLFVTGAPLPVGATSGASSGKSSGSESGGEAGESASAEEQSARRLLKRAQRAYGEGQWFEAQLRYEDALELASEKSPMRVRAALGLGTLLWQRGNYADARTYVERALEEARRQELHSAIGRLLLARGHIQASTGELSDAERTLDLCTKLAAEQGDRVFGPLCRINRRLVRKLQGKSVAPEEKYRQLLQSLEESESPLMVGMSLAKSAELYADSGETDRALSLIDRAGAQYRRAGSAPAQARNRVARARLLQNQGRWDEARRVLDGLVETFRRMGAKPAEIDTLGLLARDARRRGRLSRARRRLKRALRLAREIDASRSIAEVRLSLCEVHAAGGTDGVEPCRRAREAFEKLDMPAMLARTYSAEGRVHQSAGSDAEARADFLEAIRIREERVHPSVRNPSAMRTVRANLCQVENSLQIQGAFHRCREIAEALEKADDAERPKLAATHYAAGTSAARESELEGAVDHLRRAVELYGSGELDAPVDAARARLRLGGALRRQGEREAAAAVFRRGIAALEDASGGSETERSSLRRSMRTQLAQELVALESWKEARTVLNELRRSAHSGGDVGSRAWALSTLARVDNRTGHRDRARRRLERALPLARKAGDEALVKTVRANLKAFGDEE
ncbi:MAG: tetratricopeptide repeat protein [Bradymonadaceae bacterium]